MFTAIVFIVILSILVVAHEFGHFITARKAGMKVYEFGIGFPPRAFGVYKNPESGKFILVKGKGKSSLKETVGGGNENNLDEYPATLYSFNLLPLGGFVKIKGENGENSEDSDSFGFHKAWKRITVLASGVTMNFLLAAVLLCVGFMIGLPAEAGVLQDKNAIVVEEPAVMVQQVQTGSPAERAGIKFADKIVSINGIEIKDSSQMVDFVKEHGYEELFVGVERGGKSVVFNIQSEELEKGQGPKLGVMLADAGIVRYTWYVALYKGFVAAGISLLNIFIAFCLLIKGIILGQGLAFSVSGPVGIATIVGDSARLGFNYLLNITAMISLSLTVINILPIPALDGGRILFIMIEKIIRRPVPIKYEQLAHTMGFLFLMFLIILVTVKDVVNLF